MHVHPCVLPWAIHARRPHHAYTRGMHQKSASATRCISHMPCHAAAAATQPLSTNPGMSTATSAPCHTICSRADVPGPLRHSRVPAMHDTVFLHVRSTPARHVQRNIHSFQPHPGTRPNVQTHAAARIARLTAPPTLSPCNTPPTNTSTSGRVWARAHVVNAVVSSEQEDL